MVILIVIGALGTVIKELVLGFEHLEIRGQVETVQTTALLWSANSEELCNEYNNNNLEPINY